MSIIMAHRFNAIQFNSIKRRKTTKLGRGGGHPRLGVAGRFYSQTRLGSKQLFKQLFKQFKTEFNDLVRALLETNQATVSLISLLSLSLSRSSFSFNTKNRGTSGTSGFLSTIGSYIMVSAASLREIQVSELISNW